MSVTASDWAKGIGYSIAASIIGGGSKLAIRKSWLMVQKNQNHRHRNYEHLHDHDRGNNLEFRSESNSTGFTETSSESEFEESVLILTRSKRENNTVVDVSAGAGAGDDANPDHLNFGGNENNPHGRRFSKSKLLERAPPPLSSPDEVLALSMTEMKTKHNIKTLSLLLRLAGMFGMTFLNPLFCVLAMNYASPSILAPFSGLTLVWIVLFSEAFIGEKPTRRQIIAACWIVTGEVMVAVFGDHTNDEEMELDDVVQSYQKSSFQLYFLFMFIWIASLAYMMIVQPTPFLRRFAWGVSGGSINGFQNFLKDSLTIMKATPEDESYPWYLYVMMFLGMATAFIGLLFLTACMKRYDATFSSAMYVGSFVISASIMAAVHYQTFEHLDNIWNWILYPMGLIVLMIGVRMLVNATEEQEIGDETGDRSSGDPIVMRAQTGAESVSSYLSLKNDDGRYVTLNRQYSNDNDTLSS